MKTKGILTGIIVFVILICSFPGHASAIKDIPVKADSTVTDTVSPLIPAITAIRSGNRFRNKNTMLFDDYVTFTVKNLSSFLKDADSCQLGGKKDSLCPILLFINGMPVNEIQAHSINKTDSTITFKLYRGSETLRKFHLNVISSVLPVSFSLGIKGSEPLATSPKFAKSYLKFISNASLISMISMIIIMLITFRWLVLKTNLIRTSHSGSKYSLGLAQLLFWVVLIAFAFVYIYVLTDGMHPITGSVLTLLSISLTTSGGSRIVDKAIDPGRMYDSASVSFIEDILSDDVGYSVHRVQMAIWTGILGLVFCYEVIMNLAMPQFDTNLLLLMGISSSGYIGLKAVEHTKREMKKVGAVPPSNNDEKEAEPEPEPKKDL